MGFWLMAFNMNWVNKEQLRIVVKTDSNPFGEITADEFKQITGDEFIAKVTK